MGSIITSDSDVRISEGKICLITNLRDVEAVADQEWIAEVVRETGQPGERSGAYFVKLLEKPEYRWEITFGDVPIFGVREPKKNLKFGLSVVFDSEQEVPEKTQTEFAVVKEAYEKSLERLKKAAREKIIPDEEIPAVGIIVPFTEESPSGRLEADVSFKDDGVYLVWWIYRRDDYGTIIIDYCDRKIGDLFSRYGNSQQVVNFFEAVKRYGQPRVFIKVDENYSYIMAEWTIGDKKLLTYATEAIERSGVSIEASQGSRPELIGNRVKLSIDIQGVGLAEPFKEADVGYTENLRINLDGKIEVSPARLSGFCPASVKSEVSQILKNQKDSEDRQSLFDLAKTRRVETAEGEVREMSKALEIVLAIPDDQFCLEHVVGEYMGSDDEDGYYSPYKVDEYVVFSEKDREKSTLVSFVMQHNLPRAYGEAVSGLSGGAAKAAIIAEIEKNINSLPGRLASFVPEVIFKSPPDESLYGSAPDSLFKIPLPIKVENVIGYYDLRRKFDSQVSEPRRLAEEAIYEQTVREKAKRKKIESETEILSAEKRRELLDRLGILLAISEYLKLLPNQEEIKKLPIYHEMIQSMVSQLKIERVALGIEEDIKIYEDRVWQALGREKLNIGRPIKREAEQLKQNWFNVPSMIDSDGTVKMLVDEGETTRDKIIEEIRRLLPQAIKNKKTVQLVLHEYLDTLVI